MFSSFRFPPPYLAFLSFRFGRHAYCAAIYTVRERLSINIYTVAYQRCASWFSRTFGTFQNGFAILINKNITPCTPYQVIPALVAMMEDNENPRVQAHGQCPYLGLHWLTLTWITPPYVLEGVKYIDLVSLAPFSGAAALVNFCEHANKATLQVW